MQHEASKGGPSIANSAHCAPIRRLQTPFRPFHEQCHSLNRYQRPLNPRQSCCCCSRRKGRPLYPLSHTQALAASPRLTRQLNLLNLLVCHPVHSPQRQRRRRRPLAVAPTLVANLGRCQCLAAALQRYHQQCRLRRMLPQRVRCRPLAARLVFPLQSCPAFSDAEQRPELAPPP